MIKVTDPSRCCGCTACKSICPHNAITMSGDRLGFLYPQVNVDKCTGCGLCEKVCAFVADVDGHMDFPTDAQLLVNAVRHIDSDVVAESQSGGAFTAFSDIILEQGGVVYGAGYTDLFTVAHIRTATKQERNLLRGSKYTQSDLQDTFWSVKNDLKGGQDVMFSGTPCQVAGLRAYIPESLQQKLYLVDFVCHGVPSPAVWKDYLKHMGRHGKIVEAKFRDKKEGGWNEKVHQETFTYANGIKRKPNTFRILFYKNVMLRHSCSVCPYHAFNHKSDVTFADFWGVGEILPAMDGDVGTSMAFSSTDKGRDLFEKAKKSLNLVPVTINMDFMSRKNPNLVAPTRIHLDRDKFEDLYATKGFLRIVNKWGHLGWRYRLWKLKVRIKKIIGIK